MNIVFPGGPFIYRIIYISAKNAVCQQTVSLFGKDMIKVMKGLKTNKATDPVRSVNEMWGDLSLEQFEI